MKKETKDVAVKQNAAVATYSPSDFGADNIEARDVLLPRMALVHATSKAFKEKKAKIGEIVNTSTGKVLAKEGERVQIIPLKVLPKTYVVSAKEGGKWLRTELMKPGEEREFVIDNNGVMEKHERCLNFYVLVRKEMGSEAQPYFLAFKGGAFKYGQKLINHITMSVGNNRNPLAKVFDLFVIERSNAENQWLTFDVAEKDVSTDDEIAEATDWVAKLRGMSTDVVTRYEQESTADGSGPTVRDVKPGVVQENAQF